HSIQENSVKLKKVVVSKDLIKNMGFQTKAQKKILSRTEEKSFFLLQGLIALLFF
ncbi:MAG: hypothetical protein CI949_66, partial [Halanaerobium sp.]